MTEKQNVLAGVLKSQDDLRILLKKRWYRIPAESCPARGFKYVAFYQPAAFGKSGGRIEYYAKVSAVKKVKRIDLLPEETSHPRAYCRYLKLTFRKIHKLKEPVRNTSCRRVVFGFTNLKKLRFSKDILELFGVPDTERIMERWLKRAGLKPVKELVVSGRERRFRLDFAVFCKKGKVAVECDNDKAHSGRAQVQKDKNKDKFLRKHGWQVVRLKEADIVKRPQWCVKAVKEKIRKLKTRDRT